MSEKKNKQFYVYTKAFSPSWNWDLKTREPFFFFFLKITKKILPLQEKKTHTQNSENDVWTQKHTTNYTQKS